MRTTSSNVVEIHTFIEICSVFSFYFQQSGLRTKELKKIATKEGIAFTQFLKYFEMRCTKFTYNLLLSILKNWRILVKYFSKNKNYIKAEGFYKVLTDYNKIKLYCFLTDLGYLHSRF